MRLGHGRRLPDVAFDLCIERTIGNGQFLRHGAGRGLEVDHFQRTRRRLRPIVRQRIGLAAQLGRHGKQSFPTVTDRFAVTGEYDRILERFEGRPYEMVLTWFERDPETDLFDRLRGSMDRGDAGPRPVEILEVGEVIHHTPVYAIFICESLRDYAAYFVDNGLRPTACRSHIAHVGQPADAQLRYSLMSGV